MLTESQIPEETEILIMASPKKDITDDERVLIEEYIVNGGLHGHGRCVKR